MTTINIAGTLSQAFDEEALHFAAIFASTDPSGGRVPPTWGTPTPISVSLQDITADELERLQAGEYTHGSMYAFTSATLGLGDRIQVITETWEVVQILATSRHIAPGRNQYLVTRV